MFKKCPEGKHPDATGKSCHFYKWNANDNGWSECSEPCGSSFQTRTVTCQKSDDNTNWKTVNNQECQNANIKNKPSERQSCKKPACVLEWRCQGWVGCNTTNNITSDDNEYTRGVGCNIKQKPNEGFNTWGQTNPSHCESSNQWADNTRGQKPSSSKACNGGGSREFDNTKGTAAKCQNAP
jgi:hypothetical protein